MSKVTLAISVATMIYSGASASPSVAADYPERPVRVIVPAAPGGGADVGTRIIAGELTRQMASSSLSTIGLAQVER